MRRANKLLWIAAGLAIFVALHVLVLAAGITIDPRWAILLVPAIIAKLVWIRGRRRPPPD